MHPRLMPTTRKRQRWYPSSWWSPAVVLFGLAGMFVLWKGSLPCDEIQLSQLFSETVTQRQLTNEAAAARIMVIYTGPSNIQSKNTYKKKLYELNLDYFLKYGIDCRNRDTVITVSADYYERYYPKIQALNDECEGDHFVRLITRRNVCYDMESVRMFFQGAMGLQWQSYGYLLYLNCGVTGPHPSHRHTWVDTYLGPMQRLDDTNVHMTGLSLLCQHKNTHIQSMMYAVDRVGMEIIQPIPFDCLDPSIGKRDFINMYERRMGRDILDAGYAIQPITLNGGRIVTAEHRKNCTTGKDIWITSNMKEVHNGTLPSLRDTIFWKTSRFIPDEVKELIGYEGHFPNW